MKPQHLGRSSHRRCSLRKDVLRNFAKFTGKHLFQRLFFKKESLAQVFSCEFCEISKNTFFTEHLQATASNLGRKFKSAKLIFQKFGVLLLVTFVNFKKTYKKDNQSSNIVGKHCSTKMIGRQIRKVAEIFKILKI